MRDRQKSSRCQKASSLPSQNVESPPIEAAAEKISRGRRTRRRRSTRDKVDAE